ncbi:MAG: 23S rRNA (guanosine(2251)-2'-O)-methyltransferase RlmB [Patulibacter sp.]|nr:23S rRNA (guanosine(2251)-2'-O)-methyltransferase RlmB [Patulibacter sp.]
MTPKSSGGGAGRRPRQDRPAGAKGARGRGAARSGDVDDVRARDQRRAENVQGGKTARDARRAEGGRKNNKPRDPSKPDPRGEGYWGDKRGPEYWKAKKLAAKGKGPDPDARESRGRPDRRERTPRGRGEGPDDRAERFAAAAPALPKDFRHDGQLLYGRNAVHEALRAGRREIRRVWATALTVEAEQWLAGVDVKLTTGDELTALAGSGDHQGVVAAVDAYPYVELETLLAQPNPLILALDEVQDPQNLGSLARTAECVGATGLVICRHRAAEVTPSAAKASAGAVEHLPIAQVRNLADALTDAKQAGCWIYGAAGGGDAVPYDEPDYDGGVVLVMGAEGTGLRDRVTATCDALVALPLRGAIDSLNVGAAGSALLYAILQQRDRLDSAT